MDIKRMNNRNFLNVSLMEYSNIDMDLSGEKRRIGLLSSIIKPVYKEILKEMAEQIDEEKTRKIFYSLSLGEDILEVSKRMRISPKNLAYIYKKGCYIVCSKWKSSLEYKRELYRMHIRCRNIESLLTSSQNISEQELVEMTKAVKCIIPTECVDLLATPLIQLNINFRTLRALRKYNISQLEDLLRFIKHNGFDFLRKIPNIGKKSSEQLLNKLKEKNIMEDKESSSLFRYLV